MDMNTHAANVQDPEFYFARVKPYNPKRGHHVTRIVCMGRTWAGGDGVHQVPSWVKVNREQAERLMNFRQSDRDPESPRVFDIVTPELRAQIDAVEEEHRKAALGYGRPLHQMPNVRAAVADMTAADPFSGQKGPSLQDLATGKTQELGSVVGAPAQAPAISAEEVDLSGVRARRSEKADVSHVEVAGRAAAMTGFDVSDADANADASSAEDDSDDAFDDGTDGTEEPSIEAASVAVSSGLPAAEPPKASKTPRRTGRRRRSSQ